MSLKIVLMYMPLPSCLCCRFYGSMDAEPCQALFCAWWYAGMCAAHIIGRDSLRPPCVRVRMRAGAHACVCVRMRSGARVRVRACVRACGGCRGLGGAVRHTHTLQFDSLRTQLTPLHPPPYTTIPPYPHPDRTIHRPLLCDLIF